MRAAIVALGLMCCASVQLKPGECLTSCGMIAEATGEACEELRELEADVVYKVGWTGPHNPVAMCRALDGWRIEVHPALSPKRDGCSLGWQIVEGFCVKGYTHVDTKTIELASGAWRSSSLAHEMVHVADTARGIKGGHCWSRELKGALGEVTGRPDLSSPEPECSK